MNHPQPGLVRDHDPSELSAAMASMTVAKSPARPSASSPIPPVKNVWQSRIEQQQQRMAREAAEAEARVAARARDRERQEALLREHVMQQRQQLQQQLNYHAAASNGQRSSLQHGYSSHYDALHARVGGPASPWSHPGAYAPQYSQPVVQDSNAGSDSANEQTVWKNGLVHDDNYPPGPPPSVSNAPPGHARQNVAQENKSGHANDLNAQDRSLRNGDRQHSAGFCDQLGHYILQVLLPPLLPQKWQLSLMENGRRNIEELAQSICPGAALVPFGSVVNGLALRNSDLDLCLVLDENVASLAENEEEGEKEDNTRDSREILERLGSLIRKKIPYLYCQYKTRARIPVIKLYARRQIIGGFGSNWNHFNADISVGNVLAISNTRLLKAYCNVDERFKSLVLFLKIWTSRRKINEAFHGTLSSYGWSLMAAHFCMYALENPLLPNLQDIERPSEPQEDDIVEGYDVYFSKDLKRLQDYFKTLNPTSLGSLIIDFFKYYASKFDYENDVISIRKPQTRKIDKGWEEDMDRDHNFICIEDPFKIDYNVGRVVQSSGFEVVGFQLIHQDIMFGIFDMDHNKLQIRQELMRAKDILQHAQDTRQYIGMTINHLLEPGEGIIKKRLKISREGDIFQQNHMNAGRIVPIPPGGGMLASLPVLESVIREDDFPALGSAVTRHVP